MKYVLLAFVIGLILVSGCTDNGGSSGTTQLPESAPNDLYVKYEWGDCYAEHSWSSLEMDNKGNVDVNVRGAFNAERNDEYTFTGDELIVFYQDIVKSKFFDLSKDEYTNGDVVDDDCYRLQVRAGGKSKTVYVSNVEVSQAEAVINSFDRVLDKRNKNWNYI